MTIGSNYVVDLEDEFFGLANDLIIEVDSQKEFIEKMLEHYNLVSHLSVQNVVDQLAEMWDDMVDHYREIA